VEILDPVVLDKGDPGKLEIADVDVVESEDFFLVVEYRMYLRF
jgi:hypothetical protein